MRFRRSIAAVVAACTLSAGATACAPVDGSPTPSEVGTFLSGLIFWIVFATQGPCGGAFLGVPPNCGPTPTTAPPVTP